jgi:hypothetical protein
MGDAPCHGKTYHDFPDSRSYDIYPNGDPQGRSLESLLGRLRHEVGVDEYTFSHIHRRHTEKMLRVFRGACGGEGWITEDRLGRAVEGLRQQVDESIMRSMSSRSSRLSAPSSRYAIPAVYNPPTGVRLGETQEPSRRGFSGSASTITPKSTARIIPSDAPVSMKPAHGDTAADGESDLSFSPETRMPGSIFTTSAYTRVREVVKAGSTTPSEPHATDPDAFSFLGLIGESFV